MAASMRYEDLRALAGRECRLRRLHEQGGESALLPARLSEVGERREMAGYEQFALLFIAEGAATQGTYEIRFDGDEPREIFLVPVARDGDRIVCEACFNRPRDGGA